jgi:hypothetical protein
MHIFYTYLWLREDGTPYYVGKGTGKRAIRKSSPQNLDCILIQEHPSEADAFAAEIFLIICSVPQRRNASCPDTTRTNGALGGS